MQGKIVIGIVGVIIAIMIAAFVSMPPTNNDTEEWISSGPFSLDKKQYLLGENIFLITTALLPMEKGEIQFILPSGGIYKTIPFDGELRTDFNQYFTPFPTASLKVCTSDDLVGNWIVNFHGTNYEPIKFEIIDEYLPGEEYKFVNDCDPK